ncbi:MAG: hypothetical protein PHD32_00645 [Eubacteriales bacterium]|nr:hypothetical protein [Eubacteriales bacterium]
MVREVTPLVLAALLVLLPGCVAVGAAQTPKLFWLRVCNGCGEKISGIRFIYALNGKPVGDGYIVMADGSAVPQGEVLSREFIPEDFPGNADLSGFSIAYRVIMPSGEEVPVGDRVAFCAGYGRAYSLALRGTREQGFSISPNHDKP